MSLTAPLALVALIALALVGFAQARLISIAKQAMAPQAPRIAAALLALAGVAGTGLASLGVAGAAGLALVGTNLVENGPVRRVTIERGETLSGFAYGAQRIGSSQSQGLAQQLLQRAERSLDVEPPYDLELGIDWAGDISPERVRRWLRSEMDLDAQLIHALPMLENGQNLTRLLFGVEFSPHERQDFQDLQLALNLPSRVTIEIGRQ